MANEVIYLVEDDESIRELVVYALSSAGFTVLGFEDGKAFWRAVDNLPPALAMLDIMLPGDDGLEILKQLKQTPATAQIPAIMLTAKAGEYDKVKGLDLGADDYITKPFGVMELLSRVRAVLRRASPTRGEQGGDLLQIDGLILDSARRTVQAGNEQVELTYKEFELLAYLMKNKEIVLSRDKIMERVWGFDYEGESRTVDMHIKTLRRKLGEQGSLIRTVRGVGYKLSTGE